MGVIRKQKAEFLLNSIRQGGVHDLMKKEMLKLLLDDGYDPEDIEYYLTHNKWLNPRKKYAQEYVEQYVEQFMDVGVRRTQRMKRAIINITVFTLLVFGILFGISFIGGDDDKSKANLSPAPIEETTDGNKAL